MPPMWVTTTVLLRGRGSTSMDTQAVVWQWLETKVDELLEVNVKRTVCQRGQAAQTRLMSWSRVTRSTTCRHGINPRYNVR